MRLSDEILDRLDELVLLLGRNADQRSSVQINTSARGQDVTVKVYPGSPVREAADEAIAEYRRIMRELNQQGVDGFEQTLKALK